MFLSSPADIAIYGGAAGGGKTWALLMEPLRHSDNPLFGAVIFRHTSKQVHNEGGLWDQSAALYPLLGAEALEYKSQWRFPSGAKVTFDHMEHESDKYNWDGSQLPFIGLDELTHFSESQFWYITSRGRSLSGVRPYVRATCNPDVDSWVADFIGWWINQATGYPIRERSGVIRWFVRVDGRLEWADSAASLQSQFPGCRPKSFTFVAADLSDNRILDDANPEYRASLEALPLVERERLLGGNWKIRPSVGNIFREPWFRMCGAVPSQGRAVRYWDKAGGTSKTSDYSAGVLIHEYDGEFYIADVVHGRWTPKERNDVMLQTADLDVLKYGRRVELWIEEEPGHNSKESKMILAQKLIRFAPRFDRVITNKVERATPLSAACESGLVRVVASDWSKAFVNELCAFPNPKVHDDQVDAASGAFNKLIVGAKGAPTAPPRSRKFALPTNGR